MLSTTYDTEADALYISIRKGGAVARTEVLDEWTLVDVDENGSAIGVEVIHPARDWPVQEFLNNYRIAGSNRELIEEMFPSASGGRGRFHLGDVQASSEAEAVLA